MCFSSALPQVSSDIMDQSRHKTTQKIGILEDGSYSRLPLSVSILIHASNANELRKDRRSSVRYIKQRVKNSRKNRLKSDKLLQLV